MKKWVIVIALVVTLGLGGMAYADCRGCCSSHGGVVCVNGVTKCADGTSLSATCQAKGCNKCEDYIPPPPVSPLEITANTSTNCGVMPLNVEFSVTINGGESPYSYFWDFGDGLNSTDTNPEHVYDTSGYYTATVTITDANDNLVTESFLITVQKAVPSATSDKIKIASFNIQVFGTSKADKENVMQDLAEIISRFDIVAIQEIRDISETAIEDLETVVDNLGVDYEYVLGPRLGRTSSKEQYAYMYQTDTISCDGSYTYDDSEQDFFHREPFIAKFKAKAGNFDFVLITIHTDPDEATEEISVLPLAVSDAQNHFTSEKDFIILGDLNADCSYFDEDDQNISLRDTQYTWLIDNSLDTNVASSQCTYDRIIILDGSKEDYSGTSNVFRFDDEFGLTYDEATDISDHYPVWSEFYIDRDTNTGSGIDDAVYFPHIASGSNWETEIALINSSATQVINGNLIAYDNFGTQFASLPISLNASGRQEVIVGEEFSSDSQIGYLVFQSDYNMCKGYTKFYIDGVYRVAVPAVSTVNTGNIYVSHIASTADWWTGISLVNTTSSTKVLTIEFDNGENKTKTLAANEHSSFTVRSLFSEQAQPDIQSAVIKNRSGIVGLELFGSTSASGNNYLSGILLKDDLTTRMHYPHIASDSMWWTGVVAYNPSTSPCDITIIPYSAEGAALPSQDLTINGMGKYIGTVADLDLPVDTAWFQVEATSPISGFELFGTCDGNQLGGYTGVDISSKGGIFAKLEKYGWTGIAFVNSDDTLATVTLTAYDDNGSTVATETISLSPHEKVVNLAERIFTQDISTATYIGYSSNKEVVGFQLNGSADNMLLDALPGM